MFGVAEALGDLFGKCRVVPGEPGRCCREAAQPLERLTPLPQGSQSVPFEAAAPISYSWASSPARRVSNAAREL